MKQNILNMDFLSKDDNTPSFKIQIEGLLVLSCAYI